MPQHVRALYIHIPFCRVRCGYCDFYSQVPQEGELRPLVDALLAELRGLRATVDLRPDSIFIGGGTPTMLPPAELARLLSAAGENAAPADRLEFTVEANPDTIDAEMAATLARGGVNRVSLGAQSFDPRELRILDRRHEPASVTEALATCRAHGIARLSLDLIFGVPGQTLASWQSNLARAVALGVDHLSCYGLTYEPGTPLHQRLKSGRVQCVDPDLEAEMYELTIEYLAAAGYEQYEISNFARPGAACRHNLVYWYNEPYIGIGPSAAGYIDGMRYRNVADTQAYVDAVHAGSSPQVEQERLAADASMRETVMLGLRLRQGIDRARFSTRFGHDPADYFRPTVEQQRELGYLELQPGNLRLTRQGLLVADSVAAAFL